MDVRRLSDLNITIEPSLDNNAESIHNEPYPASMTDGSSESFDEDDHVSSWMKNTLLNSSIFNKDDDDDEVERSSALSDSS
jgi:hypothetical protein